MMKFDVTQAELAFHIGKNQTSISNYINGTSEPDVSTLVKIYHYFGISLDLLVLSDMKDGKVITEEMVANFRANGNVSGKNSGKNRALSGAKKYQSEGADIVLNEPDLTLIYTINSQFSLTNGKLDKILNFIEETRKKG